MSKELPWTGERYIPGLPGNIALEHLHRYKLASRFVRGLNVLDIASGEGYGTAMLADTATAVTGVDIDPVAVAHANEKYAGGRIVGYYEGSCAEIPESDASMDAVVSFETLEHHDKHDEFMREVVRVLKPDGFLIISSPNKRVYSDVPHYKNPFHVKELYLSEFMSLLLRHFTTYEMYGQLLTMGGSLIGPLDTSMEDSMYYIAVASVTSDKTKIPFLGTDFFTLPNN